MSDRRRCGPTPRLGTTLTLLVMVASVLVAPMRTHGALAASSPPDGLPGTSVPGNVTPAILHSASRAPDAAPRAYGLAAKEDEQPGESALEEPRGESALEEPRVSFFMSWRFRKDPDRRVVAPFSILSLYHLRC